MDCCALNRDNSAVKATAKFSGLHNETTAQNFFYINFLEDRKRQRRKVNFYMDCCALNRDNSAVKATAKFSRLHNETTAPSFLILIAWRIGRDHRERQIAMLIASLKIETTAQSRLLQNYPDFTTRPQHRAYLKLVDWRIGRDNRERQIL